MNESGKVVNPLTPSITAYQPPTTASASNAVSSKIELPSFDYNLAKGRPTPEQLADNCSKLADLGYKTTVHTFITNNPESVRQTSKPDVPITKETLLNKGNEITNKQIEIKKKFSGGYKKEEIEPLINIVEKMHKEYCNDLENSSLTNQEYSDLIHNANANQERYRSETDNLTNHLLTEPHLQDAFAGDLPFKLKQEILRLNQLQSNARLKETFDTEEKVNNEFKDLEKNVESSLTRVSETKDKISKLQIESKALPFSSRFSTAGRTQRKAISDNLKKERSNLSKAETTLARNLKSFTKANNSYKTFLSSNIHTTAHLQANARKKITDVNIVSEIDKKAALDSAREELFPKNDTVGKNGAVIRKGSQTIQNEIQGIKTKLATIKSGTPEKDYYTAKLEAAELKLKTVTEQKVTLRSKGNRGIKSNVKYAKPLPAWIRPIVNIAGKITAGLGHFSGVVTNFGTSAFIGAKNITICFSTWGNAPLLRPDQISEISMHLPPYYSTKSVAVAGGAMLNWSTGIHDHIDSTLDTQTKISDPAGQIGAGFGYVIGFVPGIIGGICVGFGSFIKGCL